MQGARITVTKMNGPGAGEQHQSHFFSVVQHPQMPLIKSTVMVRASTWNALSGKT